jgi:glutathione S-transferase
MIKLFYAPGTCALAPHIVLEWIGEPYDLQKVKQSDPEYLKLNPLGQVPAMIDGESGVMNQASALLKYLARKYPAAKLGDDGTLQDGYDLDRWMAFLTGDVHPAFFPFFMTARYSTDSSDLTKQSIKAYAFAMIRWGNLLPTGLANYPNLDRFYHHWREDEGVKLAMEQQQIS